MKSILRVLLPIFLFSLTIDIYTQDEDWIKLTDKSSRFSRVVHVASNEKYIQLYPLNEVALWLYTHLSFTEGDNKINAFIMSRIRFNCYLESYTVMSTHKWVDKNGKSEITQVQNAKYIKGWKDVFKDSLISRKIWKFARDYFK